MKTIKFRGISARTLKMIYWESKDVYGAQDFWGDVKDETVGQFTGLRDRNGKEIYEGDVFPCLYAFDGCADHVMIIEWNKDRAGFFPRWDYEKCQQKGVTKSMYDCTRLEIIGNIYENPELVAPTAS